MRVAREYDALANADDGEYGVGEFLQQISLLAETDNLRDDDGIVTLMTMHNAKGLEFPIVFMIGMEDGVFPHSRALDEGGLEEERRLAYVGITRAMRELTLTHARRRNSFGGAESFGVRSRFIDEIPRELTDQPAREARGLGAGRVASWAGAAAASAEAERGAGAPRRRPAPEPSGGARSSAWATTSSTPRSATASWSPPSRAASSWCASRATARSASSWPTTPRSASGSPAMRRLLLLVSSVVLVETAFYAVITPLLPELSATYGLSKGQAGVLAAAYPAGTFAGALPGGWLAARAGVRPTVLIGLAVMVLTSLVFAFAGSLLVLDVARFFQGAAGAACWAGGFGWLIRMAPAERRGELIGAAMSAAIGGALLGPVLGAAASAFGARGVFCAVAVAGLGLIAWARARRPPPPPAAAASARSRTRSATTAGSRSGMWLTTMPGLLFGTISVLVPLRLDVLGAGAAAIAAVFLVAAALEALVTPISGRLSDRRGRLAPCIAGLTGGGRGDAAAPAARLAPGCSACVAIASAPLIGLLWAPGNALFADGAEAPRARPGLRVRAHQPRLGGGPDASARRAARGSRRPPATRCPTCCWRASARSPSRCSGARRSSRRPARRSALMAADIIDGKAIAQAGARRGPRRGRGVGRRRATTRPAWRPCSSATTRRRAVYVGGKQKASRRGRHPRLRPPARPRTRRTSEVERAAARAQRRPGVSGHPAAAADAAAGRRRRADRADRPAKDVDGLTPISAGLLAKGRPACGRARRRA